MSKGPTCKNGVCFGVADNVSWVKQQVVLETIVGRTAVHVIDSATSIYFVGYVLFNQRDRRRGRKNIHGRRKIQAIGCNVRDCAIRIGVSSTQKRGRTVLHEVGMIDGS